MVATGRRVDWVHIPTLDRTDASFYAPLAKLDPKGARVYVGMIHSMPSFDARLALVRKVLPDFGLAAYCGFGRTPPDEINQVLADHLDALKRAGAGGSRAAVASAARDSPGGAGCPLLDRRAVSPYNARRSAIPRVGGAGAQVAQLVEHVTENHGVGGSIPPLGTTSNT